MRERQCADGGWNFGNASVYDVDLKSYPQTTAVALIALQGVSARSRPTGAQVPPARLAPGARWADARADARRVPAPRRAGVSRGPACCSRGPRDAAGVPSPSARRCVGRSRDGTRRASRAVEVAGVSLTRRQLLVRVGRRRRPGSVREARSRRSGWARSTRRRPFDRSEFPEPGRSAVAVLRAASYDGDLEGLLLDGLRLVEPDVRGRSVLLKPNLVEYAAGSSINTDPRLVVAAANTLRRMGAASVVVAEGPGHRRDTEAVMLASGMRGSSRRRRRTVRRPQRRSARSGHRFAPRTRACASSGSHACSGRRSSSSRCRSSRPIIGSASRCH